MNAHIAIKAKGRFRNLQDDQSIDIEFQNPMWNETSMFSYPIDLPLDGNRDMVHNVDDVNSAIRPVSLEHETMQVIVDGVPFASGPLVVSEGETIEDSMSVSIDAAIEDFNAKIADLQCRDIPIPESDWPSLIIGEKISDVKIALRYKFDIHLEANRGKNENTNITMGFQPREDSSTFEPQALGFSFPGRCYVTGAKQEAVLETEVAYRNGVTMKKPQVAESYINVTDEYLGNKRGSSLGPAKFCNARVCYAHHDVDEQGKTSDKLVLVDDGKGGPEDFGKLWVLDADRPQSGICFYVVYFLECLFKYLELDYDISEILAVEDLKHLCFYTTKCSYKTGDPLYGGSADHPIFHHSIGSKSSDTEVSDRERKELFVDVNKWLESRGCGGQLELEPLEGMNLNEFAITGLGEFSRSYKVGDNIDEIQVIPYLLWAEASANIVNMYADNGNFPEMSVSSLLSSLDNMFGIKFYYDFENKKVTAFLVRNVLRSDKKPLRLNAQVLSFDKITEKITGVRVGYAEEADAKEQKRNIRDEVKKYNTSYDYIDFPDPATSDGNKTTVIDKTYGEFFRNIGHGDMRTYIDQRTGNAYRIKIDENFTDKDSMNPRLFEVAQFHCVEAGDCSAINEDYVRELMSDFSPIDFVDVNYRRELDYIDTHGSLVTTEGDVIQTINQSYNRPILAAFLDEDMEHEFVEQRIRQNVVGQYVNAYLTEVLSMPESYDVSSTDDGNSPLQHYDWGNAIAMMRGGGAESYVEQYESNYDGFGNNKWMMRSGLYALTSDSIDQWQNMYDYNGVEEGGYGEHFSLKPRAYKQPAWADHPLCEADRIENGEHIRILTRGYVDTFLSELIYFLLNCQKYRVRCLSSVAEIANIPKHWNDWWTIDGKKCLINRVNTNVSVVNGMGVVEVEVYAI